MNSASLSLLAAGASAGAAPAWTGMIPFVGMIVVFWFLIIRPQMRQQKALKDKISALKKGDQVITSGGMHGKVTKVDEHHVELEIAPNVRVKHVRSTIADIVPPPGAAND